MRGNLRGRPRKPVDSAEIRLLRAEGLSWRAIGRRLGVSDRTARRRFLEGPETPWQNSSERLSQVWEGGT